MSLILLPGIGARMSERVMLITAVTKRRDCAGGHGAAQPAQNHQAGGVGPPALTLALAMQAGSGRFDCVWPGT